MAKSASFNWLILLLFVLWRQLVSYFMLCMRHLPSPHAFSSYVACLNSHGRQTYSAQRMFGYFCLSICNKYFHFFSTKRNSYGIFITWDLHFTDFYPESLSRIIQIISFCALFLPKCFPSVSVVLSPLKSVCLTFNCLSGQAVHVLYSSSKQRPVPIYCSVYLSHYWT